LLSCVLWPSNEIYMMSWSVEEAHDIISPFSCFVTCFCPTYTHKCETASSIEVLSIAGIDSQKYLSYINFIIRMLS
jgi:hypothetical protein